MRDIVIIIGWILAPMLLMMSIAWFAASQEARSYSKFCDSPVTTWDAFWLDLRIDECKN